MSIDEATPLRRTMRRMMESMKQWTGAETCELIMKAYLRLVGVTAPATAVIAWLVATIPYGSFVDSVNTGLWLFMVFVFIFGIVALGGAAVAIPFTHLLGRTMQRVRNRVTRALAHAFLAGILGAVSMQVLLFIFENNQPTWQYPVPLAVATGAAAAIARWRLDIVKTATPLTPAEAVEEAAA